MSLPPSDCTGKTCSLDPIDLAELREIELDRKQKEVTKWESLLKLELKCNINQAHDLLELKERVSLMLKNIQSALEITRENLLTRGLLKGADKVEDLVEDFLLKEVEILTHSEQILLETLKELNTKLQNLRSLRNEIEVDIADKTDNQRYEECEHLIQSIVHGVTPISTPTPDSDAATKEASDSPPPWLSATQGLIIMSQAERSASLLLQTEITNKMILASDACFDVWYETNSAFDKRIRKIAKIKRRVQAHLNEIKIKIKNLKCQNSKITHLLNDKRRQLQLAQKKFERRRENAVDHDLLCKDSTLFGFLREIQEIKSVIEKMTERHDKVILLLKDLRATKVVMERDLKFKTVSLRVDRDKCLLLRQIFPISTCAETRFSKGNGPTGEDDTAQVLEH